MITMGEIIAVSCPSAGVGKTTTVATISSFLALLGYKTLCVDFDSGQATLGSTLSMPYYKTTEITALIDEQADLMNFCNAHPDVENLYFLSAASVSSLIMEGTKAKADTSKIMPLFAKIRNEFTYCLIDTPSDFSVAFRLAHADADVSLIVANEELSALKAAELAVEVVTDIGLSDVRLLINHITPKSFKLHWTPLDDVLEVIDAKLIGLVLEDKSVTRAVRDNKPLALSKKKRAAYDFRDATRRIIGEDVPWRLHLNQPYVSSVALKKQSSKLVGSYGDPELWAKSTLEHDTDNLVKIYEIKPSRTVSPETIRNRTWVHDLFDDEGIPYKVEVAGFWATRKKFLEAQSLYVESKDRFRARDLIVEFKDPNSIAQETEEKEENIVDGITQKKCPSCDELIDFDYHKCPFCKATM